MSENLAVATATPSFFFLVSETIMLREYIKDLIFIILGFEFSFFDFIVSKGFQHKVVETLRTEKCYGKLAFQTFFVQDAYAAKGSNLLVLKYRLLLKMGKLKFQGDCKKNNEMLQ